MSARPVQVVTAQTRDALGAAEIPGSGPSGRPLRVLVIDDDDALRAAFAQQLAACGHTVVGEAATAEEAVSQAAALAPDAVLIDLHLPDGLGTGVAACLAALEPAPGLVLCTDDDGETELGDPAVEVTGLFAVLPKLVSRPLLDATLRCAAARARELAAARAEAVAVRRQLEERKVIERAKGILMRRTGASEQEAYRILQRSSQDRATPMITLAQAVLDSEPPAGAARPPGSAERAEDAP